MNGRDENNKIKSNETLSDYLKKKAKGSKLLILLTVALTFIATLIIVNLFKDHTNWSIGFSAFIAAFVGSLSAGIVVNRRKKLKQKADN